MTTPIPMPVRGDRTAPRFDPKQPRELRRYFADLDFVFVRAAVTDKDEKKKHATRYVDVDTSELWETLLEFTDNQKTFEEFVTAVYALYPGADEERKWSVADMDKLVGERSRLGIISLGDLGEYYRQFLAITTFLRSKSRLSTAEQSRAFVRGFPPELWRIISQRLQLKEPDHFPDDPYELSAIHEAARYVLHGTPSAPPTSATSTTAAITQSSPAVPQVKTEDFVSMMERMNDTMSKLLQAQANPPRQSSTRSMNCHFCGDLAHLGRNCGVAAEYIAQGKCRRNIEGLIVLPTGAFIPRDIPGRWFKERIDEWHNRNPGQMATGQLMYNVMSQAVTEPRVVATRQTHPNLLQESTYIPSPLSTEQRIQSLERELLQLRTRRAEPRTRSKTQATCETDDEDIEKAQPKRKVLRPEVVIPVTKTQNKSPDDRAAPPATNTSSQRSQQKPQEPSDANTEPPVHPFAKAADATYIPPTNRNFGSIPKAPPAKRNEPAYKTLPPVYDGKIASTVYDRAMSTEVTLTQRELLSLSPEVRSQVREATSARRTPPTKEHNINILADDPQLPFAFDDLDDDEEEVNEKPTATLFNSKGEPFTPPPGAIIVPDPYETYLKSLPRGTIPEQLIVAKESSALRSIFPLVDNQQDVECILDPGSQIIAMSEYLCTDLGLIYDPSIVLNMQSANGEVDQSLGLARNVPMTLGEITLYVQIHVIRSPAYDILLGRPFDILTESVVRNFANEDQTITIRDPNTGLRATIPTLPRGRPRHHPKQTSFATSRI
jgi:hypothetical protein